MLRRIPRVVRATVVLTVMLAVSVAVVQSWTSGAAGAGGWTQTRFGPLGPADRDLLVQVRLAGLWQGPSSEQAQRQGSDPQVRQVAGRLVGQYADLDQQVRQVADQLGVPLPSRPDEVQVRWMAEISSRSGALYDRTFVQLLRAAQGRMLTAVVDVRTGTRNDKIRAFATVVERFVTRYCTELERTGLVDFAALPTPPSPGLLSGSVDPLDLVLPITVFVASVLAAIGMASALWPRRGGRARATRSAGAVSVASPPAARAAVPGRTITDSGGYRAVTASVRAASAPDQAAARPRWRRSARRRSQ
jgi:predicted outer membrane protein